MTDQEEPLLIGGSRYRLVDRIARGGNGDVWRAHDEDLDRDVAVKLLHPHLLSDETARRRLAAEARVAASLSHPRIVQVYAVEPDGETPALVMELIEGESLDVRLAREGALDARQAASIAADIAEALQIAHGHGVVHRDVKPSNILIGFDGQARLGDFGIAHSLATAAERLTATGQVVGTMRYISPEQLSGGEVGPHADLYGLGAVLHEMLTGRPPYDASSPLALAEAQAGGPPAMPGVDAALARLTRACLAATPEDRPPNAGAVAEALRGWLAVDSDAVTRPMPVVAAPPVVAPSPVVAREPEPPADWSSSDAASTPSARRLLPIAAGAGALLLALLLIVVVMGGGGTSGAPPGGSPVPSWMSLMAADYAAACGGSLDLASLAGYDQEEAQDQVASLIEACSSPSPAKGNGNGNGNGHGHN